MSAFYQFLVTAVCTSVLWFSTRWRKQLMLRRVPGCRLRRGEASAGRLYGGSAPLLSHRPACWAAWGRLREQALKAAWCFAPFESINGDFNIMIYQEVVKVSWRMLTGSRLLFHWRSLVPHLCNACLWPYSKVMAGLADKPGSLRFGALQCVCS